MEFCIYEKVNNSIATKLCANLLNNRIEVEICLVHDTHKWIDYVVHNLNTKIK